MNRILSRWLSKASNFLAVRKGLLPLIGLALVILNFIFVAVIPGWIAETNLLLHLGIITAIIGFMIAWAL